FPANRRRSRPRTTCWRDPQAARHSDRLQSLKEVRESIESHGRPYTSPSYTRHGNSTLSFNFRGVHAGLRVGIVVDVAADVLRVAIRIARCGVNELHAPILTTMRTHDSSPVVPMFRFFNSPALRLRKLQ